MPSVGASRKLSKAHVLDASAVLVLLLKEPGTERVAKLLDASACEISAVNFAEVASKLDDAGMPADEIAMLLSSLRLPVVEFDEAQALQCGLLRRRTRALGLSLGDRACLQLALARGAKAVTATHAWSEARIGVSVEVLR